MTHRTARTLASTLVAPLVAASGLIAAPSAQAEISGILNGRAATAPVEELSVEGALQLGDDIRFISARVNYAVGPTMTAFANVGQGDFDESTLDGFQLGGGVFLHLVEQRFAPSLDIALKPSVAYGKFSAGPFDLDQLIVAGEALVSGREPIGGTGLNWYANAGLAIAFVDTDFGGSDQDLEPILGAGIHLPVAAGTLYAGVDYIDDLQFGVGFRYGLR